jgi:rhomboid protease GluP
MQLRDFRLKKSFLSSPLEVENFYFALFIFVLFVGLSIFDWSRAIPLKSAFSVSGEEVFDQGQVWRLFTAIFAHANWEHLLGNAIFFVPFATFIKNYFGFFVFPILILASGGLINLLVIYFYPKDASLLGVSGVVYFMVAFWLVLYIGIERGLSLRQKILRSLGLVLIEFMPQKYDVSTSYLSHGIGFVLGIFFGFVYFWINQNKFRGHEVWELIEPELVLEVSHPTRVEAENDSDQ